MTKREEKLSIELDACYRNLISNGKREGGSFSAEVQTIMNTKKWNAKQFCTETGLSDSMFKKIHSYRIEGISRRTVIALCVGLRCSREQSQKLLELAGYVLNQTDEEQIAYRIILEWVSKDESFDISDAEEFLSRNGLTRLANRCRNQ